jgi:hypothetical protein
LIGIAVGDRAIAGVMHQPYYNYETAIGDAMGRTLWGISGIGAGGFEPCLPPEGKRIVTTTRSHSNAVVQAALDALQPDEVLRVGGAGHKVSTGRLLTVPHCWWLLIYKLGQNMCPGTLRVIAYIGFAADSTIKCPTKINIVTASNNILFC